MNEIRKIRLLPPEIIHRIAAGEVVDKPSSILKELVENAVDAGSTRIQVTLIDGGLRSIQVDDNGSGMTREDLEACIQRHATSKISTLEELDAIPLLGFRGEALSAASSVSRLTIDTFREGDGGWVLRVTGGAREAVKPSARKLGTRVTLEDLFFNVPARRKFLRKPGLEAQDCLDTMESLALAHPHVEFSWAATDERGEVKAQKHYPVESSLERYKRSLGLEAELCEASVNDPAPGVKNLHVVFYKPPAASQAMKSIRLNVNGRPVTDKRLPYIVREAFAGLIEVGRFPYAHVAVEVDPALIDVNIHPQKKEIRWSSGFNMGSHVFGLVRSQLQASSPRSVTAAERAAAYPTPVQASWFPSSHVNREASEALAAPIIESHAVPNVASESLTFSAPISYGSGATSDSRTLARSLVSPETTRPPFRFADLRVVGEALASWILCESPDGLVLIDQHAAHERVNFEKQLARMNLIRSKPLFLPIRFKLPLSMRGSESELKEALEPLGFECADLETVPAGEMEFVAVPESERKMNWEDLLERVISDIGEGMPTARVLEKLRVEIAASLACHGSVRRGQRLSIEEIQALMKDLDAVAWGGLCPHGRPVWFLLSNPQIETLFHR